MEGGSAVMNPDQQQPGSGLRIAWWNTGLSPTRDPNRAEDLDFQAAAAVLLHLIDVVRADLIVLGEMAPSSIDGLHRACPRSRLDYVWLPAFQTVGRSRFSICVLARKGRVRVGLRTPVIDDDRGPVVKVGMHFRADGTEGAPPLHLIACHWPSRLHLGRNDSERTHIAAFLRRWIEERHLRADPDANLLLIGDFNDEPFDEGLERYLLATRDRAKVLRDPAHLYNPFWRHMASFRHPRSECQSGDPGTYVHAKGQFTHWRTFDQLIVSSALVSGRSGWRLDEAKVRVITPPEVHALVLARNNFFDHFPIVGHLERTSE